MIPLTLVQPGPVLRRAAASLRQSRAQIALRLDYGVKLERRCLVANADTGSCEQVEPLGELSFGILYTF